MNLPADLANAAADSEPRITVFTCTVYFDIARIWHACVSRIFRPAEARLEIYLDSDEEVPDAGLFPGVTVLRQAPSRRDFQEAYNDALARVETPYLAFIDSDVYWVSDRVWPLIQEVLRDPKVAAVACIMRTQCESHGTFSVVMKTEIYKEVLKNVPEGFLPANEYMDLKVPTPQWRWFDTGDLATAAVLRAGYEVKSLHLEATGEVVMFRNITVFRRPADSVGMGILDTIQGHYFWRGYIGNLMLQWIHNNLFRDGARYRFPLRLKLLLRHAVRGGPREMLWKYRYVRSAWKDARKVRRFIQA